MRSLAFATVWEYWRRVGAAVAVVVAVSIGFPALLFAILPADAVIEDKVRWQFQFIFLVFDMFTLCCVLCGSQAIGPGLVAGSRRHYQFPISTASLVAGQLLCGMAAAALSYLLVASTLNALFPLNWPLAEPPLVTAAVYACVQTALWLPTRIRLLQLTILTAVSAPLFFWVKSKFGPMLADVQRPWLESGPAEVTAVLGLIVAAYGVAVWGVSRDRAGASLNWFGWQEWVDRPLDNPGRRFGSPQQAQFWYEWRQKGLIMPGIQMFFTLLILVGYYFGGEERIDLVRAIQAFGAGFCIISLIVGLIVGSANIAIGRGECGSFLGTRPITDAASSAAPFKVAALSLLITSLLWAATAAATTLWLWYLEGTSAVLQVWPQVASFPAPGWPILLCFMFVLSWATLVAMACLAMTGRPMLVFAVCTLVPGTMAAYLSVVKLLVPEHYAAATQRTVADILWIAITLGVAVAAAVAVRCGHLQLRSALLGLAMWVVPIVLLSVTYSLAELRDPVVICGVAACWAIALSPPAMGTLAMAWNRHR